MAQAFSDEKLNEYIEETEIYVLPLLKTVKQNYMEYNNAVFLIKYHMLSVLESLKNMMMRN
jgi:GTP pyrophosphokinase